MSQCKSFATAAPQAVRAPEGAAEVQTAKATDEISEHISAMQHATDDTVAAIQGIAGSIGQMPDDDVAA